MEHDEPYMAHVAPGRTETIVWQFTKAGTFHFGCLMPGHFEAGMIGKYALHRGAANETIAFVLIGALRCLAQKSADIAGAPRRSGRSSDGEVRKVDKAANKVTFKHGPIPNIDMPAMTMVFQVKDPAMLDEAEGRATR